MDERLFKNKLFQGMENCEHFPWAIHHLEEKKTYKSYLYTIFIYLFMLNVFSIISKIVGFT